MLTVRHSAGSYTIESLPIDDVPARLPERSFVITDENVFGLYGDRFSSFPTLAVPAGEASKRIDAYTGIVGWLAEANADRKATIVALGGGVVGDLAGFVAATYMRGVRLIQIPTTLLAQVDSSVGGKVGVDLPQGKNLVGAFAPPESVFVATGVLATLPPREFAAGMAEVCKTGFIMDADLASLLVRQRMTFANVSEVVLRCIQHKANVVEEDEFETKGLRAILNFGHTIGHAIEQVTGYGPVLHGEAIGVGMRLEARLAERLGIAETGTEQAVIECLEYQGVATKIGLQLEAESLLSAMRKDKKRVGQDLPFSLVTRIGACKLFTGIAEADVKPLLDDL